MRAALVEQSWQPGRQLTFGSDGEAALPNMVRAATDEPVRHILDWTRPSTRMRPIERVLLGLAARHLPAPEPVNPPGHPSNVYVICYGMADRNKPIWSWSCCWATS